MSDDQVREIKEFIASAIFEATADMATKDDLKLMATKDDLDQVAARMATKDDLALAVSGLATKEDLGQLDRKLSGRIDDLDLKLDTISDTLNEDYNDHGLRISKLEQRMARV